MLEFDDQPLEDFYNEMRYSKIGIPFDFLDEDYKDEMANSYEFKLWVKMKFSLQTFKDVYPSSIFILGYAEISLEEQLKLAIEREDYRKAAEIHKKLNGITNN